MALYHQNRNLLNEISWEIYEGPLDNATIFRGNDFIPLTEHQWQQVVLPGRDFRIIYPVTRYYEHTMTVVYEAQGQPVTTLDLLTSIYEFYQELLSDEDIINFELEDDAVTRLDGLDNLISFEGLTETSPNTYRLNLAS